MRKLTDNEDLIGETIRYVADGSDGRLVIVFESDCWAVVSVKDGNEDASASIEQHFDYLGTDDIKDYLDPDELVNAGLLTPVQREYLVAEQNKKEADRLRKYAEKMLKQADQLAELQP